VQGGLLTLVLFFALITVAFKLVGRARKAVAGAKPTEFFVWAIGAALFSHICSFFGSSYWDQTEIAWFVLLAIICAVSHAAVSVEEPQEATVPLSSARGFQPASAFHPAPPTPWERLPRSKVGIRELNSRKDPNFRLGHRS
jgi:O-antigen ligase